MCTQCTRVPAAPLSQTPRVHDPLPQHQSPTAYPPSLLAPKCIRVRRGAFQGALRQHVATNPSWPSECVPLAQRCSHEEPGALRLVEASLRARCSPNPAVSYVHWLLLCIDPSPSRRAPHTWHHKLNGPTHSHTCTPLSISRARFIAPFTCLTPLFHCTTLRALNLP